MSISGDGNRIAWNSPGDGQGSAHVFEWISNNDAIDNGSWKRMGLELRGQAGDTRYGNSIALSRDGSTLAVAVSSSSFISASENVTEAGRVEMYRWPEDIDS